MTPAKGVPNAVGCCGELGRVETQVLSVSLLYVLSTYFEV